MTRSTPPHDPQPPPSLRGAHAARPSAVEAPTRTAVAADRLPTIIQGGMGVAISDWRLARTVAQAGELGVVSGTALDVVCVRRLQDGDPGGHVRRALAHFPIPRIAEQMIGAYYLEGGRPDGVAYRTVPMFSARPARLLRELTVAATFVEVFLAKEGHDGAVGINFLRKIEAPIPFGVYGAMLAGVDVVLVGAGNPHELPPMLTALAQGHPVRLDLRVQGRSTREVAIEFDPSELFGGAPPAIRRPHFLAIVASNDLAAGLATSATARPEGFVVEGPTAGGHNAPPRGPRRIDERAQPIYGEQDAVDLDQMRALDLPFWLAGHHGTPAGLEQARAAGAMGVQVGTAFALCAESGLADELRRQVIQQVVGGNIDVLTDWRASPTGFPFKVIHAEQTLSDPQVYAERERVCDLGALRVPYERDDGKLGYRCPAEPVRSYTELKGAREANTVDRKCLCNALLATAGYPQIRRDGSVEPPLITTGNDLSPVADLVRRGDGESPSYGALDVIDYLYGR
jgi:NAD(P)H-dependent flavin oxidoreductase YrpB (nitropropane dioxygenase family)